MPRKFRRNMKHDQTSSFETHLFGDRIAPTPAGTPPDYHLVAQCESVRVYADHTDRGDGGYVAYAGDEPTIGCPPGGFLGRWDALPAKSAIEAFAWAYQAGFNEGAGGDHD